MEKKTTDDSDKISPGDTVRLKSGGSLMVVASVVGDTCMCSWIDAKGKPFDKSYKVHMLDKDDGSWHYA